MKFNYKFSQLIGSLYNTGNIFFDSSGTTLLTAVHNMLSAIDLRRSKAVSYFTGLSKSVDIIAMSPSNMLLIMADEYGNAVVWSTVSNFVLAKHSFHSKLSHIAFSPDGHLVAFGKSNVVLVYEAPGCSASSAVNPFSLHRLLKGCYDEVTFLNWSSNSRLLVVGSKDGTTRVMWVERRGKDEAALISLVGHKAPVVACFFAPKSLNVYSLSEDATLLIWNCDIAVNEIVDFIEEEGTEEPVEKRSKSLGYHHGGKHFYNRLGDFNNLTCAAFNGSTKLLAAGFANGDFQIHEMPDFIAVQTLNAFQTSISTIAFNTAGDWLALASQSSFLVWEWQCEVYVIRQSSSISAVSAVTYSPDGTKIATGSGCEARIWDSSSGLCLSTMSGHSAEITDLCFQSSRVMLSCSLDGSVRAYDIGRYRSFRTLVSTNPTQLSCVTADSGGIVAAGCARVGEVIVWSLDSGRLLEVLSVHEEPISGVCLSQNTLISSSWDGSIRFWRSLGGASESVELDGDITAMAIAVNEIALATLCKRITFVSIEDANIIAEIECRGIHYTSLKYTPSMSHILAAYSSIDVYDVSTRILIRKIKVNPHLTIQTKKLPQLQPKKKFLPGDLKTQQELSISKLAISCTGESFAVATAFGVYIYSQGNQKVFNPHSLKLDTNPRSIRTAFKNGDWLTALMDSFSLGEVELIREIFLQLTTDFIKVVSHQLPFDLVLLILKFISEELETSAYLEFYLDCLFILLQNCSSDWIKDPSSSALLSALHKSVYSKTDMLTAVSDQLTYSTEYCLHIVKLNESKKYVQDSDEQSLQEDYVS